MNKKNTYTTAAVIFVIAIVLGLYFGLHKNPNEPKLPANMPPADSMISKLEGNTEDLVSFSVLPDTVISEPIVANGGLKGAWFFEANAVGRLLDADKNVIKTFPITASSDWMTVEAVFFTVTIDPSGMSSGKGYIRLENDNPSGDPAKSKHIDIPVVFK